jgi:hypothetical protein
MQAPARFVQLLPDVRLVCLLIGCKLPRRMGEFSLLCLGLRASTPPTLRFSVRRGAEALGFALFVRAGLATACVQVLARAAAQAQAVSASMADQRRLCDCRERVAQPLVGFRIRLVLALCMFTVTAARVRAALLVVCFSCGVLFCFAPRAPAGFLCASSRSVAVSPASCACLACLVLFGSGSSPCAPWCSFLAVLCYSVLLAQMRLPQLTAPPFRLPGRAFLSSNMKAWLRLSRKLVRSWRRRNADVFLSALRH